MSDRVGRPAGVAERCVGANLTRLRLDRGLSQAALAERAGLSGAAVGQVERGVVVTRTRTLIALAQVLGTTLGDLVTPVRPLRSVRFRVRRRLRGREQILAEVSKWLDACRLLRAGGEPGPRFRFGSATEGAGSGEPEAVARKAREAVGMDPRGPAPDICGLLEEGGVQVLRLHKKRDSFFGLGVGAEDGGPAVVVNTWERISVERWIFTAARELGHLLLHSDQYHPEGGSVKPAEVESERGAEREADRFASEFLMPEATFGRVWETTPEPSLLDRVLRIKRLFRVSYRTVLYRLVATGRRDAGVWAAFHTGHRNRFGRALRGADERAARSESDFAWNWRRSGEPAGLTEHDFAGDRRWRLLRRALDEQRVSVGWAAEVMGVHLEEMREWVHGWSR